MKGKKLYKEPASRVLQETKGSKGKFSFVDNRTKFLDQKGLLNVIQVKNGATLINWRTKSINANKGNINHTVAWDSSTGLLADLEDVYTREHLVWKSGCPWATNDFFAYKGAGEHFGLGGSTAERGEGYDEHSGIQPYANKTTIQSGTTQYFTMEQVYQYSLDGITYNDIPNSQYILMRTLCREKGLFQKNNCRCTLTKLGLQDTSVNVTTSIDFKL